MAVTQQLARLETPELLRCRASIAELDRLCSFEMRPSSDYLDLDWAPSWIVSLMDHARAPGAAQAALRRAFDGDGEINPAYRDGADTIFGHPVTALDASSVQEIAATLSALDVLALGAALPVDPELAIKALGPPRGPDMSGLLVHPREYLLPHLGALITFYDEAARRGLAAAQWWD